MAMANFHRGSHRLRQICDRDQIHAMRAQGPGVEIFLVADDDLARVSLDLNHVKRRTRGHAEALALAHGEVVDAAMLANDLCHRS